MVGVVARVEAVKKRMQSFVQLNLEPAKVEAKQKATAIGIAGGLGGRRRRPARPTRWALPLLLTPARMS